MADTSGQALIRGINIDKVSKDYLNEASVFRSHVRITKTSAREIRWYQRTSGFLSVTSPATIKVAEGARPFCSETSWTRNTSYINKYLLDTPIINMEDESDSEVKVFLDNMKLVVETVAYEEDGDIWDVASESQSAVNLNSVTCTAPWDSTSGQDPLEDVAEAVQKIREQTKRKVKNLKLFVSAKGEKDLRVWLTSMKGSSWSELASKLVVEGILSRFGGCSLAISENVTDDYAWVGDMKECVELKEFVSMKTAIINEELIGRKG